MKKLLILGIGLSIVLATLSFVVRMSKDAEVKDIFIQDIDLDELGRC